MIQIERYTPQVVTAFHVTEGLVGDFLNEHEFNKFRIRMLETETTADYFFMWNDIKILVDETGCMDKYPHGMYDQINQDLSTIYQLGNK